MKLNSSSQSLQLENLISQLIKQKKLPTRFIDTVEQYYLPLCKAIFVSRNTAKPTIIGLQGAQGTGKSTCASFLKVLLESQFGLKTLITSLDDFYLTRPERSKLAADIHPLFVTRGVPGTHDIHLLETVINNIQQQVEGATYSVPLFDKSVDDRYANEDWLTVAAPIDIMILEGWCVGISPQKIEDLNQNVNTLESEEDDKGIWRRYVNEQLEGCYADIFLQLDFLVTLQAPSFDCVYQWRSLQEKKMIANLKQQGRSTSLTLNPEQLERFISHYERLTKHALETMPSKADWLVQLREDHSVCKLRSLQDGMLII